MGDEFEEFFGVILDSEDGNLTAKPVLFYNKSEKEAKDYIIREDRDRRDYIKKYFNKDIDDVYLYDLVVNLDNVPLEDAVRAIGEMVLKGKGKTQPV